jgi:predicted DsbA family dithiol-disulfide isomerase
MSGALRITEVDAPAPRRTSTGAVVLEWWVDLACPDTADSVEPLDELRERFGDALDVRLRHFPLTNHVWAVAAAQCQVEAERQGQGWAYAVRALHAIDEIEGPADYVDLAEHLGLDADEVAAALFDGRHARAVRDDHDAGRELGVVAVPTFVVDGLMVDADPTREGLVAVLAARITAAG